MTALPPEDRPDSQGVVDPSFAGFLTLRCKAPGCPCQATGLVEGRTLALAWAQLRWAAAQVGWIVDRNGFEEDGVDYCHCPHPEARMPR